MASGGNTPAVLELHSCRAVYSDPEQRFEALVNALETGNEVLTAGGVLGKVTAVSEHYVTLQIADNVEIKVQKSTVSAVVPKGTFDAA